MKKLAGVLCVVCALVGLWLFLCRARIGGETILMDVAREDFPFATKVLLLLQADVNAKNETGATPLFYAAANGREANVELLLGAGANVDARDGNGLTPLCVATAFAPGDLKTMQLLLDHEMSPRAAATAALLCLEESRNRETKLRLLIYKGGDPKTLDRNGNPLLIYYAEHDDDFYDVVQGLHEAGNVDLSVRSQAGHTALMVAANRGNEATVNVLLWMGADCLVKADDGRTALDMAREEAQSVLANKDHYRKIIEMLTRCQQQAGSPSETRPPARRP